MNLSDKEWLRRWMGELCVTSMICLSVTAPAIVVSSALPYFKTEQLLLPVAAGVYLWMVLAGVARNIRFNAMFTIGLFYCLCNAISIWYGAALLGHEVVLRDFYELPKVWLPVAFFTIAYECALPEVSLRRLIRIFSLAILAVCFYSWAQFAGLGFTYKLNSYYSSGGHIDQALEYAGRVYATAGNPNVLGELMTWSVILFVLAFLFRVGSRLQNLLVALSCLVTLVMTGSRFGFLTVCVGIILVFVLVSSAGRRSLAQVSVLLLLIPFFAWTYRTIARSNKRTLERYETLRNPLQIDSLRERLDDLWREEWTDFTQSPVIGHGPAKAVFRLGYTDSEYLEVLRGYGVLGLVAFLGYYTFPLSVIWRGYQWNRRAAPEKGDRNPATLVCLYFGLILTLLALLMNVPMSTFYNPFLQGFTWLWLGVSANAAVRQGNVDAWYCVDEPAPN